jgi:uncharacterized protein involved in exopolysaccharide biosynthesis
MEQENRTGSLRDFLNVLFKQKSKIIIIFLSIVITVAVISFLLPPTYEAKSSLLVKFGREYIYRSEVGERTPDVRLIAGNQEELINSEIQVLNNRDLIGKVITALGIEKLYPDLMHNPAKGIDPLEIAISRFQANLSAEGIKKSNVVEVSFQHKDPQIVAKTVNLLVDLFKEKHLQVYSDSRSPFLEKQLTAYEQKLRESGNNLEAFTQKNKVFSLDEQMSLLLNQRTALDTSLKDTQNRTDELRVKLTSLNNQKKTAMENKALYTPTERDRIIVEAKARLLSLQLQEQELSTKYNENNRLLVNVRKEIQLVTNFLQEQEEAISGMVKTGNVVYQEVEREILKTDAELSAQKAKAVTLKQQLNQVNREIQNLDLKKMELQSLKREVSTNEKNYQTYIDRSEEARISEDMDRQKLVNISVIQTAAVPMKPIKPKKALNIFLSIILGAVSSFGFAFFSEYTKQSLSTPEEAEKRMGIPVLSTLPFKR